MSTQEKITQADYLSCKWLAAANEQAERGNQAKAEALYAKASFWLDRWNRLTGNS